MVKVPACALMSLVVVFVVVMSLFAPPSADGVIYFYDTTMDDPERFAIGLAQRCHSFSCYSNSPSSFTERKGDAVRLGDGPECSGNFVNASGHSGELDLTDTLMYNKVSSFIAWESGMHSTHGFIDECPDRERDYSISL
jgi:hypothetical protein